MRRGGRAFAAIVRGINATVSAALESSRVGPHLGRAVTTISYVGRRSGRTFSTPVAYKQDGDRITILADLPDVKNWWRNFTGEGGSITLSLGGAARTGHAIARRSSKGWATVTIILDPPAGA